jgi:hypothetical protein
VSLSISISVSLSSLLSLSLSLFASLSLSLFLCPSFLTLSLSVPVSLCLPVSPFHSFEQELRARFEEELKLSAPTNPGSIKEKDPAAYRAERASLSGRSGPLPTGGAPLIYLPEDPDVAITQDEVQMIQKILETNCISACFEQFLGQYVLLERRNLEEMLER